MKKISFYTLGCKVNQYETQAIKEQFENSNYEVVRDGKFADVYIINSCSVTGISDRKTRQFLRKTKKLNPDAITVLTGCYAETGTEEALAIEEVDIVLGNGEKGQVFNQVESVLNERKLTNQNTGKIVKVVGADSADKYDDYGLVSGMDSRTRAYIKIEDGCDRFCSYCIIPHARGPVRSRPVESVLREAKTLIDKGYKELILTGINAALYGTDFYNSEGSRNSTQDVLVDYPANSDSQPGIGLIELIEAISSLDGEFRIRLSSLEPTVINADYAKRLVKLNKLCPHLHLSLQSGSDRILDSMGRRYTRRQYLDIVDVLKSHDPNYSITTDIIVGYPGESNADFEDSLSMVREVGFSKVHVFKYSKRTGTPAATMPNQIQGTVKKLRSESLIETSGQEADAFVKRNIDTVRQALVLEYNDSSGIYHAITDNNIDLELTSSDVESHSAKDIVNQFIDVQILDNISLKEYN